MGGRGGDSVQLRDRGGGGGRGMSNGLGGRRNSRARGRGRARGRPPLKGNSRPPSVDMGSDDKRQEAGSGTKSCTTVMRKESQLEPTTSDAVKFIRQMQETCPELYPSFLGYMQNYQSGRDPVGTTINRVFQLFKDHPNIVEEFKGYLPINNGSSTYVECSMHAQAYCVPEILYQQLEQQVGVGTVHNGGVVVLHQSLFGQGPTAHYSPLNGTSEAGVLHYPTNGTVINGSSAGEFQVSLSSRHPFCETLQEGNNAPATVGTLTDSTVFKKVRNDVDEDSLQYRLRLMLSFVLDASTESHVITDGSIETQRRVVECKLDELYNLGKNKWKTELQSSLSEVVQKVPALKRATKRAAFGTVRWPIRVDVLPKQMRCSEKEEAGTNKFMSKVGKSYDTYPVGFVRTACSSRTQLDESVLNDEYFSVSSYTDSPDDVACKCDPGQHLNDYGDEARYEFDRLFHNNARAIERLTAVEEKMLRLDDKVRERLQFDISTFGGPSTTNVDDTIKLLFMEEEWVISGLRLVPVIFVPRVLAKLKCRENEWRELRGTWNTAISDCIAAQKDELTDGETTDSADEIPESESREIKKEKFLLQFGLVRASTLTTQESSKKSCKSKRNLRSAFNADLSKSMTKSKLV